MKITRKISAALFFSALVCMTGCSSHETKGAQVWENVDTEYSLKQICMCDALTGWGLTTENELIFTTEGMENFTVVRKIDGIDMRTDGFVSGAVVDEKTVYLVYFSEDGTHLAVEYTEDGGLLWQKTLLDYGSFGETCDAGSAYISVDSGGKGYLLYCSAPGAGMMTKILLETDDGGKSFSVTGDLSDQIAGYPQGISFGGERGYIAVSYHGNDSYLYVTADNGTTWTDTKICSPDGDTDYIDGYPPVFYGEDSCRGVLVLKAVGGGTSYRLFTTDDGGCNWIRSGEIICESMEGYDCIDGDDFIFLDSEGNLFRQ